MIKTKALVLGISFLVGMTGCSDPGLDSNENVDSVNQSLLGDEETTIPVAYWTFDTCAGNVVANEEGYWGEANLAWGATCAPGAFGNAGVFDGIDDRAWVSNDSRLNFTYEMTVSAWVNPNDTTAPQTILGKWYSPDSYLLWLSDGFYKFSVALADGRQFTVSAPATSTPSGYSEVVGSYLAGHDVRLKVNGNTTSVPVPGNVKVPLQSSSRNVTIGNHPSWNAFAGKIDEVKLFDVGRPIIHLGPGNCAACNPPASCCDP